MNDPKNTSTDLSIEQEAERMRARLRQPPSYMDEESPSLVRVDGDHLNVLLRDLATLRRKAAAPLPDKLREIEERAAKPVYPELDAEELGESYFVHLNAMTAEKLHDKSAIAAQLAWRDNQIDTLLATLRSRGGEGEGKP